MILGLVGSRTRHVTAMFARKSSSGAHEVPPLVVFQTPPATPAAYITSGITGSMTNARVRPPTFPGPSDCQVPSAPLVDALPSPAPPPPVPVGNSPSPGSRISVPLACVGRFLPLADENRFMYLIFSLASK